MKWLGFMLVTVLTTVVQAQEDGKITWSYFVLDGDDVDLFCNDSNVSYQPEYNDTLRWSRESPGGEREQIEEGNKTKYEFIDSMGLERLYLRVKDVQMEDYGPYYCAVWNHTHHFAFELRKAINVNGQQFATLGAKYKRPVTIGCVATAVAVGLLLLIGVTYKFRWHEREKSYNVNDKSLYDTDLSKVNNAAFDNPALYVNDDDQKTRKEDMEMTNAAISNGKEETTTIM